MSESQKGPQSPLELAYAIFLYLCLIATFPLGVYVSPGFFLLTIFLFIYMFKKGYNTFF